MWDIIITRILGHALAHTIFKESPEDAAKRIAEEKRLLAEQQRQLEEKERKQRERVLRALPIVVLVLMVIGSILYLILHANK